MKNTTIMITNPGLTTLYVGQLIRKSSLSKVLSNNFANTDEIDFSPYNEVEHKKLVAEALKIYPITAISKADYEYIY